MIISRCLLWLEPRHAKKFLQGIPGKRRCISIPALAQSDQSSFPCNIIRPIVRKHVFGHMQITKAQINLLFRAVWSWPSLPANRLVGHYRMLLVKSKGPGGTLRMHRLIWIFAVCACSRALVLLSSTNMKGTDEGVLHILHMARDAFVLDTVQAYSTIQHNNSYKQATSGENKPSLSLSRMFLATTKRPGYCWKYTLIR